MHQSTLRVLVLLEAILWGCVCLFAIVSGAIELSHPFNCLANQFCLDLRGLLLWLGLVFGLPTLAWLSWGFWLLRRPRHWALLVPVLPNLLGLAGFVYGLWVLLKGSSSALVSGDGWTYWVAAAFAAAVVALAAVCWVHPGAVEGAPPPTV